MIIYVRSNIFTSPAKVLVNTVNTVGVMGKGLALEFKKIYPKMFKEYRQLCKDNEFRIGKLWMYYSDNKWILNFPTKKNWRNKSKLLYIKEGLQNFVHNYQKLGVTSIAFPELGVGNGGLDWEKQVKPLMEKYLSKLPIYVYIHLYNENEYMRLSEIRKLLTQTPVTVDYYKVIKDLRRSLKKRPINSITMPKRIYKNKMSQAFQIQHGNIKYYITKLDIERTWNNLISMHILFPFNYPSVITIHHDYSVFNLLWTNLKYVSKIPIKITKHIHALVINKNIINNINNHTKSIKIK